MSDLEMSAICNNHKTGICAALLLPAGLSNEQTASIGHPHVRSGLIL